MAEKQPPWWYAYLSAADHALCAEHDRVGQYYRDLSVKKRKAYFRAVRKREREVVKNSRRRYGDEKPSPRLLPRNFDQPEDGES